MKFAPAVAPLRARGLLHAAFWGATLIFFILFFGREADSYTQSVLFVGLLLPVAMGTTYILTAFLVPRYLLPGRYGLFALYGIYTLVASIYLEMMVLLASFIFLARYDLQAMNPATLDVFGLVVALYAVVFLALAGNLAMRWHRLRLAHDRMERARLEAELELREAELERLKAQMQPHFLFNTLNNLYGLTLERSDDAPEVVLRISQMLDYVLYGCERPLVPLSGEIEHLHTYVELERLRYDERVDIQFDVGEVPESACIAPLLLTPFVENSFKHGAARSTTASWVHVRLRADGDTLDFRVENGKPEAEWEPVAGSRTAISAAEYSRDSSRFRSTATDESRASGIGLENVRRRLRLLYPGNHSLEITDHDGRYTVRLRLPIHVCSESQLREEAA